MFDEGLSCIYKNEGNQWWWRDGVGGSNGIRTTDYSESDCINRHVRTRFKATAAF